MKLNREIRNAGRSIAKELFIAVLPLLALSIVGAAMLIWFVVWLASK